MKFEKKRANGSVETTELPPGDEAATKTPAERETVRPPERTDFVPRRVRPTNVRSFSRAAPRSQALRVVRPWPGVTKGQIIYVNPAAERRLVLGGFVEVA